MFTALANAIAFEVGFRSKGIGAFHLAGDNTVLREDFVRSEVRELRINSGLPEGTRAITVDFVAEAIAHKTQAEYNARRVSSKDWYIVYSHNGARPSHVAKTRYVQRVAAQRAVDKLNARYEGGYTVLSARDRVARGRLRIVRNLIGGAAVLEPVGTSNYCSVASEAY